MTKGVAVELQHVSKRFGESAAVHDVSLQIAEGEFFSLLGPSGCGKTTTLRMIAGFELPDAGEVLIQGRPMGATPPYRRHVNTVFQNYALFPHLTVAQNVAFGLEMQRVARAEIAARVAEALRLVRLDGYESRRPRQLSGGQQQRVALARALVNHPAVLLLDEPLGALDESRKLEILPYLVRLRDEAGVPMVYVSHDAAELRQLATQIVMLRRGQVTAFGGVKVLTGGT